MTSDRGVAYGACWLSTIGGIMIGAGAVHVGLKFDTVVSQSWPSLAFGIGVGIASVVIGIAVARTIKRT